jgi:hypothetical protein
MQPEDKCLEQELAEEMTDFLWENVSTYNSQGYIAADNKIPTCVICEMHLSLHKSDAITMPGDLPYIGRATSRRWL